ncbi:type I methionyl aminopeptidase [Candidatus Falkowbacteria bacterium]|uniref:Methionine aminopeptidase n=1 Tax=Candidatus Buchananbacteria bacterium CG10_big_fil_rev_8_21_14_0_10_33_19 TaxID=1974525 RepID=A0A2H0W396_9BACT|nr:type I methionyl aminopeptidase [Candidatus Falkowbacteria bacterium]PIS05747.1 MAG: type I methionyl aminopeptidase [Candidatus Buchananbacteria bacterium CG10_big_fil_rev_8_21_14_0_10_33_19]
MIRLKTKEDIEKLKRGGKILSAVLDEVEKVIKPGITTQSLTDLAEKIIIEAGGRPSFKGYKAAWADGVYPAALCVSINEEVVHGIPAPNRVIKEGDIVGIDCGLEYEGRYTDMARTIIVGKVKPGLKKLVSVTQESLMKGIKQVKPGNKISDISRAIEEHVKKHEFSVVRQLVGHGVGFSAHEDPQIPNFVDRSLPDVVLKAGMVIAIEPMVNVGGAEVDSLEDGWTIVTHDSSISAHFEHTVAVTEDGYEIITK